ncbi:MAG: response regulator, partial [Rubrivivax sp.]
FEVARAVDAAQARERLRLQRPDLVLMDIQLPGVDGLALTREIKADAGLAGVRVVAFTAYAMQGDEARFRDAGCDGYLAKPIDVGRFAEQVRGLLGRGLGAG